MVLSVVASFEIRADNVKSIRPYILGPLEQAEFTVSERYRVSPNVPFALELTGMDIAPISLLVRIQLKADNHVVQVGGTRPVGNGLHVEAHDDEIWKTIQPGGDAILEYNVSQVPFDGFKIPLYYIFAEGELEVDVRVVSAFECEKCAPVYAVGRNVTLSEMFGVKCESDPVIEWAVPLTEDRYLGYAFALDNHRNICMLVSSDGNSGYDKVVVSPYVTKTSFVITPFSPAASLSAIGADDPYYSTYGIWKWDTQAAAYILWDFLRRQAITWERENYRKDQLRWSSQTPLGFATTNRKFKHGRIFKYKCGAGFTSIPPSPNAIPRQ